MAQICDRQISATFLRPTPFIQKGALDSMNAKSVVCAGVCTIQRPEMLAKCLRSLAAQKDLDGLDFKILVVDNDATPSSAQVVEAVASSCPFPIHYYHEPRRGIPMARNRVLESASAIGADWLAFFDDDQRAFPDTVEKLLFVAKRDNADAVAAGKIYAVPEPQPFWFVDNPDRKPAPPRSDETADGPIDSRRKKEVATNGVLFSSRLFRADGMALRFDERLALGGLEDGDFSERACRQGALLVDTRLAEVSEERHPSRFTYWRQVQSSLARGGAYVARYRLTNSYPRAAARYSVASVLRTMRGLGQLAIAPIFIPFSMQRSKFTALEGGRNLFTAAGMVGALFSLQHEFYRKIDGC
jgi:succinoglycan biosynthesis protein ExoM